MLWNLCVGYLAILMLQTNFQLCYCCPLWGTSTRYSEYNTSAISHPAVVSRSIIGIRLCPFHCHRSLTRSFVYLFATCSSAIMCVPTTTVTQNNASTCDSGKSNGGNNKAPVETLLEPPSITARYTCASILLGAFSVWGKLTFVPESQAPGVGTPIHDFRVPLVLTVGYLVSLPILRIFAANFLSKNVDVKLLLRESMILYNAGQVLLNGWMVYRFIDAVLLRGHPFVGDVNTVSTGATYAVWVHYCDKYLEFFDTYFMVLRGKMDQVRIMSFTHLSIKYQLTTSTQVSFLHVYHHVSIAWAWWYAMSVFPGGDSYFGALLNSWIHVMMYSYYALALLRIRCPWKRFLTMAQLMQFLSVLIYTIFSFYYLKDSTTWSQQTAWIVQTGEMVSLFALFLHFYKKAYSKTNLQRKSSESTDSASDTTSEQASLSSESTDDVDDQPTDVQ
jgi:GNS1/SUR4 family